MQMVPIESTQISSDGKFFFRAMTERFAYRSWHMCSSQHKLYCAHFASKRCWEFHAQPCFWFKITANESNLRKLNLYRVDVWSTKLAAQFDFKWAAEERALQFAGKKLRFYFDAYSISAKFVTVIFHALLDVLYTNITMDEH